VVGKKFLTAQNAPRSTDLLPFWFDFGIESVLLGAISVVLRRRFDVSHMAQFRMLNRGRRMAYSDNEILGRWAMQAG